MLGSWVVLHADLSGGICQRGGVGLCQRCGLGPGLDDSLGTCVASYRAGQFRRGGQVQDAQPKFSAVELEGVRIFRPSSVRQIVCCGTPPRQLLCVLLGEARRTVRVVFGETVGTPQRSIPLGLEPRRIRPAPDYLGDQRGRFACGTGYLGLGGQLVAGLDRCGKGLGERVGILGRFQAQGVDRSGSTGCGFVGEAGVVESSEVGRVEGVADARSVRVIGGRQIAQWVSCSASRQGGQAYGAGFGFASAAGDRCRQGQGCGRSR